MFRITRSLNVSQAIRPISANATPRSDRTVTSEYVAYRPTVWSASRTRDHRPVRLSTTSNAPLRSKAAKRATESNTKRTPLSTAERLAGAPSNAFVAS